MKTKIKIVFAEDEISLAQIVSESLETRNFEVIHAKNGKEALDLYHIHKPNIIILDVMMPMIDGFTVAKKIREKDLQIPILFLTAKSQTNDVVEGFSIGGNDYLKKPFSLEELIVRIRSLIQRNATITNEISIQIGNYNFNYTKQTLTINNYETPLTHRECELLLYLIQNKNELSDRTILLKKIWGNDDFFSGRSMDVFISKLRKKLKNDSQVQIINVRGYGYKLIC